MRLPGLIDPHVHFREPGATHKEDWESGTAAALAGGFTQVLAMPNTQPPVLNGADLAAVDQLASRKAHCDYAHFLGASAENVLAAAAVADQAAGLKLYLDQTYGPLCLDELHLWQEHYATWPKAQPLVVHAEGRTMAAAILVAALADRPLHLAHVSTREEILMIRAAKEKGWHITCEVTPHHLFLVEGDLAGGRAEVRPALRSRADVDALWENLDVIDCFATDHAPHTAAEKDGDNPPPGFPGLETALPLFLTAVRNGRLNLDDLVKRMSDNVRRIFRIPHQPETYVEVDLDAVFELSSQHQFSKAGWTPFEGFQVSGAVRQVVLRGQVVYDHGRIRSEPGSGKNIRLLDETEPGR